MTVAAKALHMKQARSRQIIAEPTGYERDLMCDYWAGERHLDIDGMPVVVRAAFVSDKVMLALANGRSEDRPTWFAAHANGFIEVLRHKGAVLYALDLTATLTPDAAVAYRANVTCECCGRLYERGPDGVRPGPTRVCWSCDTYHQSPYPGSQSYRTWAIEKRAHDLARCPSYRRTHAALIARVDPGPDRDEAVAAHRQHATEAPSVRSSAPAHAAPYS